MEETKFRLNILPSVRFGDASEGTTRLTVTTVLSLECPQFRLDTCEYDFAVYWSPLAI
jgi:hypothetical protein